jgi:hypothetical protein
MLKIAVREKPRGDQDNEIWSKKTVVWEKNDKFRRVETGTM